MNVLNEILQWSQSRPLWQRDALRRLATKGVLEESDVGDLTRLCKVSHGLDIGPDAEPIVEEHVPGTDANRESVTLVSLTHHSGVNALASEQTVEFGPTLTIVYGDNAAGKSGFTRIIKSACRARGAEEILGNVLSGLIPLQPSSTVKFAVGGEQQEFRLAGETNVEEALGRVSVFDSHCASVYLSEKTDVAFRPFGLDLFDKLSAVCEGVRLRLESERAELRTRPIQLPDVSAGTAAYKWVTGITSLSEPEEGRKLGQLSEAEKNRIGQLNKQLADVRSTDPQKTGQALQLSSGRIETLANSLRRVESILNPTALGSLFDGRSKVEEARQATQDAKQAILNNSPVEGTGSSLWRSLWEAAREFSVQHAYPSQHFPVLRGDAKCVLCQQTLDDSAVDRLRRFEDFVRSAAQKELERLNKDYEAQLTGIRDLEIKNEDTLKVIEELAIEEEELARVTVEAMTNCESRRQLVMSALDDNEPLPACLPSFDLQVVRVSDKVRELRERSAALLRQIGSDLEKSLFSELQELEARVSLADGIDSIIAEITRKKQLAAYEMCLRDTDTRGITRKSSELTKAAVTEQLTTSFKGELRRLGLGQMRVDLRAVEGSRGVLYHQILLTDASSVSLAQVASEGEARALSLAAFFSELSTASDASAILFDDPVSSFDHQWRDNVARRLAEEAGTRQVIVFTHDVVFLLALVHWAEEIGVDCKHQHLRKEAAGAGVSSSQLPWVAMRVRERIGVLKNMWQRAEKLHRTATQEEYEREAIFIYGRLRGSWERALEEVLLGGVVVRYRSNIQTQQIGFLSDIIDADCKALEQGMTKSSRWMGGHDLAAAENVPIPDPQELEADISALENWVSGIRRRRR